MADRSPEEIRRSIEANREALAVSIERLRGEVAEITDWRKQLTQHQRPAILGAVIAGFLAGGGLLGARRKRSKS
jgi:redox-regulated HSP33 family molecular chaperone